MLESSSNSNNLTLGIDGVRRLNDSTRDNKARGLVEKEAGLEVHSPRRHKIHLSNTSFRSTD